MFTTTSLVFKDLFVGQLTTHDLHDMYGIVRRGVKEKNYRLHERIVRFVQGVSVACASATHPKRKVQIHGQTDRRSHPYMLAWLNTVGYIGGDLDQDVVGCDALETDRTWLLNKLCSEVTECFDIIVRRVGALSCSYLARTDPSSC